MSKTPNPTAFRCVKRCLKRQNQAFRCFKPNFRHRNTLSNAVQQRFRQLWSLAPRVAGCAGPTAGSRGWRRRGRPRRRWRRRDQQRSSSAPQKAPGRTRPYWIELPTLARPYANQTSQPLHCTSHAGQGRPRVQKIRVSDLERRAVQREAFHVPSLERTQL